MSDGLSWAAAVDTSQFDDGLRRIEEGVRDAASNVEFESERIQALFTDIPEIDIKAVTNMPETADEIGEAYAAIAKYQRINEEAVRELTEEYNRLTQQINKFQNVPEKRDEVAKWRAEKAAITENIALRRNMIQKTEDLTKVVNQNEKAFTAHQKTQSNVKMRIREVMQEMAALRNEAFMSGTTIDESSGHYRELAEELGRLKDIQGDVAQQAKILSNDENQFQGIISGLSGLSGGFAAAQGAMALFGSENENLQKVMTQLQAVMAITMGLQQMQQMLNKDSAFRLVTLNSLRKIWNKLMGESNAVTAANNAETTTNVAATEAQATATEQETVAEEANTAARTANNTATGAGTAATASNTVATQGATAAQEANTGAIVASTVATKAATVATKLFKLALASTGIGLVVVAIGELVSWIMNLIDKESEAEKQAKELLEINSEGAKAYAKAKGEISGYITRIDKFNGTQQEEKKLLKEVNDKFGEQLGYAKNLQDAKQILASKGDDYCRALEKEAMAQAFLNKYIEAYITLLEVQENVKAGKYHSIWNTKRGDQKADQEAEAAAQADVDKYLSAYQNAMLEAQQIRSSAGLGGHVDPSTSKSGKGSSSSSKDTFDPKQAAKAQRDALEKWKEAVTTYIKQANEAVVQANLNSMEEGLAKELRQIQVNIEQQKESWKQGLMQLAEARKAYEKEIYLSKKGHTEEGWLASARGQMSTEDYANEFLNDPKNAQFKEQYYEHLNAIVERGESKVNATVLKYRNKWIKDYGTFNQQDEALTHEWFTRLNRIADEAPEVYGRAISAMESEFDRAKFDRIKKEFNWESVFENYENLSSATLSRLITQLSRYRKQVEDTYDPEIIREYNDALNKLKTAQRANENNFWSNLVPAALREQKEYQEQINDAKATYNHLCDLQRDKEEEVKDKIIEIQNLLQEMTGEDYAIEDIADPDKLQNIIDALKESNPDGASNIQSMAGGLQSMQVDLAGITEAAGEAGMALEGMQAGGMDTIAVVGTIVHAINDSVQSANAIINDLASTADALGADTEVGSGWDTAKTFMNGFAEASEGATQAFDAFKSGNPMGVIQGVVKSFTSWIKCFAAIKDAKHERTIQQIQKQVEKLQDAYSRLDRAINKAFSADASKLLNQQADMIQQQRQLIRMQIEEEKAKKNTDWDKIDDWEKQLKDLEEDYEDAKEKAIDAIFGEDVKSAIENFADAYADAWANGEDRAKSARDVVRQMMQNMVKESIKAAIQSSGAMERIRQQLQQFYADNVLSDWEQDYILNMAEELQQELDRQFGWAEKLLDNDSERQGTSKGIATASQDSVDENNARLTTIQGHTYTLVQGVNELNSTSNAMLERLSGIESNTSETNERLDELDTKLKRVGDTLENIETSGLRLKS